MCVCFAPEKKIRYHPLPIFVNKEESTDWYVTYFKTIQLQNNLLFCQNIIFAYWPRHCDRFISLYFILWISSAPIIQTALLLVQKNFKPSVISVMLTLWPREARLYYHGIREDART